MTLTLESEEQPWSRKSFLNRSSSRHRCETPWTITSSGSSHDLTYDQAKELEYRRARRSRSRFALPEDSPIAV